MGDLSDMVGGAPGGDDPPPIETTALGRITNTPATLADPLAVTVVDFTGDHRFTVPAGQWMPRGDDLPTSGCRCLLVFDDRGDAWVPAWRPT